MYDLNAKLMEVHKNEYRGLTLKEAELVGDVEYKNAPIFITTELIGKTLDNAVSMQSQIASGAKVTRRVPIFIGPPGVGKSAVVKQWAESRGMNFLDIRLGSTDPETIAGIPDSIAVAIKELGSKIAERASKKGPSSNAASDTSIEYGYKDQDLKQVLGTESQTIASSSAFFSKTLPDVFKHAAEKPTLIFLDEINQGDPAVVSGLYEMFLDNKLNGLPFHSNTIVAGAMNPDDELGEDSQASNLGMFGSGAEQALLDRVNLYYVVPDIRAFNKYVTEKGLKGKIRSYETAIDVLNKVSEGRLEDFSNVNIRTAYDIPWEKDPCVSALLRAYTVLWEVSESYLNGLALPDDVKAEAEMLAQGSSVDDTSRTGDSALGVEGARTDHEVRLNQDIRKPEIRKYSYYGKGHPKLDSLKTIISRSHSKDAVTPRSFHNGLITFCRVFISNLEENQLDSVPYEKLTQQNLDIERRYAEIFKNSFRTGSSRQDTLTELKTLQEEAHQTATAYYNQVFSVKKEKIKGTEIEVPQWTTFQKDELVGALNRGDLAEAWPSLKFQKSLAKYINGAYGSEGWPHSPESYRGKGYKGPDKGLTASVLGDDEDDDESIF